MQRHEMAVLEHFLDAVRLFHLRWQAPRRVDGDVGIVAQHVHPEPDRRVGDQAADLAQPYDAQRMVRQFAARELLLALLDLLMQPAVVARQTFDELQRRHQIAHRQQEAGQHQFLDRVRVRARCIEHRHATAAHLPHGNVVGPGTGPADRPDGGRNRTLVQVVRAHQHGVRILDILADGIALMRKALEANRRDLIEDQNAEHRGLAHPCAASKSRITSTRRWTPSIGIAL